jgi:hypothetical protein
MDDVYAKNFERVFGKNSSDGGDDKPSGQGSSDGMATSSGRAVWSDALPLLEMVCAAQEPLLVSIVDEALKLSPAQSRHLQEAVGALFPVREGRFQPIHKSAFDWLTANASRSTAELRSRLGVEVSISPGRAPSTCTGG